jgi:hypothetical protein
MAIFRALSLAALVGVLPSLVQGIPFAAPTSTNVITKGSDITATWTSIDTDLTVFSLYLPYSCSDLIFTATFADATGIAWSYIKPCSISRVRSRMVRDKFRR